MCSQASFDPAATWFNVRAPLLDVGKTFLCDCLRLQDRLLARLGEIFEVRLHAFPERATARLEFAALRFDIGGARLHRRASLCCSDRTE